MSLLRNYSRNKKMYDNYYWTTIPASYLRLDYYFIRICNFVNVRYCSSFKSLRRIIFESFTPNDPGSFSVSLVISNSQALQLSINYSSKSILLFTEADSADFRKSIRSSISYSSYYGFSIQILSSQQLIFFIAQLKLRC